MVRHFSVKGFGLLAGLTAVALCLVGAQASADVVNVDFQNGWGNYSTTYSGQGAIAAPGSVWNAVAPSSGVPFDGGWGQVTFTSTAVINTEFNDPNWNTVTDYQFTSQSLKNSQGNDTGITITATTSFVYAATGVNNVQATGYGDLMRDYLDGLSGTARPVTINGLTAGASYSLALYGHGADPYRNTTFIVGGVDKSTAYISGTGAHSLTENVDYVTYSNVVADANGRITIDYKAGGALDGTNVNTEGSFNGLQIQSVPEPATSLALLSGLIGLLAYAWRRRK